MAPTRRTEYGSSYNACQAGCLYRECADPPRRREAGSTATRPPGPDDRTSPVERRLADRHKAPAYEYAVRLHNPANWTRLSESTRRPAAVCATLPYDALRFVGAPAHSD